MHKNNAFVAKIVVTRLTKGFMAMFAPIESLPSPATLLTTELVLAALRSCCGAPCAALSSAVGATSLSL